MAYPTYKDSSAATRSVKTAQSTAAGDSSDPDVNISGLLPAPLATTNVHVPAGNTAAVVTYSAPGAGICHVINGVAWSYSAAPTGGRLTITDDGNTVLDIDITAAGPGSLCFAHPLKGTANKAVVVTLAAGGGVIVGKVNVLGKRTET